MYSIENSIKYLLFLLFSVGIMIPHHWDFGIDIGYLTIYYEEVIVMFLFPLIILKLLVTLKINKNILYILLLFFIIIFFSSFGLLNANSLIIIFKDIRIIMEVGIILFAISLIKLKYQDMIFLQYLIAFSMTIYLFQYLYSFIWETYLMTIMDEGMSLGLKRIVLDNHVAVLFMLPFIYFMNKKIFIYLFIIIFIISLLSMKRTDIGLLLILSLLFIKELNIKYIAIFIFVLILFAIIILNLEFGSRFLNIIDGSADTRLYGIITAFNDFLEKPLFGYGFGKEMVVTIKNIGGVDLSKNFIDNSYLTLFVKIGLIGFLLYISIFIKLIYKEINRSIVVFMLLFFSFGFFSAYMLTGSRMTLYIIPFAYLCVNNFTYTRKKK